MEERLPLMTSSSVASIYSSLSPLGLILPSCSSGYPTSHISSSSFSERDFHLKNKLDQVARRVKFGLPLSDSAWDSFSVSSFNMRDLEVALAASFTPGLLWLFLTKKLWHSFKNKSYFTVFQEAHFGNNCVTNFFRNYEMSRNFLPIKIMAELLRIKVIFFSRGSFWQ